MKNGPTAQTGDKSIPYIKRVVEVLHEPGSVVELRCLRTRWGTVSGYFNDSAKLAGIAAELSGTVSAVYITINPVNPDLLARASNRVERHASTTSSDNDVIKRRWLPIDFDPVRPTNISSTDAEKNLALERAKECREWLSALGFPVGIFADSGNGAHLLHGVDLPNDATSMELIKKCLEALGARFTDDKVSVDLKNFNAARIWKLYGTMACKGDNIPERPHRQAKILEAKSLGVLSLELIRKLSSLAPEPERHQSATNGHYKTFGVDKFIARHDLKVKFEKSVSYGRLLILESCPFNSEHNHGEAHITQFSSGAFAFACKHNSCAFKKWQDLRELLEPGYRDRKDSHKPHQAAPDDGTTEQTSSTYPYGVENRRIVRYRQTKDGLIVEPLCNFDAQVKEEVVLDDGAETTRAYVIDGRLDTGAALAAVRIHASRFAAMSWVAESWGIQAVVRAGTSTKDYLREAIQRLSPEARKRHIFTHTGWRKIGADWIYISGSITGGADFEVDLGPELARYKLPAVAKDPVAAMRVSLSLLNVAPLRITAPLFASCYRAPLVSAFPQDLSLWLEGVTGSMKSTLAALFLSHFGDFDRVHLPGAWASTANQLERRAFLLKDSVFVIDDYSPSALDHRELETKAARLLRSQGNLAGRGRLKSDLTERPAFYPRGIIISTGEQHPPGQSLLARTLVIELDRADIDIGLLTQAQQQCHHLAHAMAGYIAWLMAQMDKMPELLRETFRGARAKATAGKEHLRIPEAAAHLWLGFHCAMTYGQEIGAIGQNEADELSTEGWEAFIQIGKDQAAIVEEEQPTRRFLSVLYTILTQGRAVLSPKGINPPEPKPGVDFLGWNDDEFFYLLPEATFLSVVRFCRDTGEHFPIRQDRLKRDLAKDKISECDAGRLTSTVRIGDHVKRILKLKIEGVDALLGVTGVTGSHHGQSGDRWGER